MLILFGGNVGPGGGERGVRVLPARHIFVDGRRCGVHFVPGGKVLRRGRLDAVRGLPQRHDVGSRVGELHAGLRARGVHRYPPRAPKGQEV